MTQNTQNKRTERRQFTQPLRLVSVCCGGFSIIRTACAVVVAFYLLEKYLWHFYFDRFTYNTSVVMLCAQQ